MREQAALAKAREPGKRVPLLILLLAAFAGGCSPHDGTKPAWPVLIQRVEALPPFATAAWAYGRDGGISARIGSRILWLFGDTITWSGLRSATAAWADISDPVKLYEAVDTWYAPSQFYPFSADEIAFNEEHAHPRACCLDWSACPTDNRYCRCPEGTNCATRIALWPGDAIGIDERRAINYYEKILVGVAPYDFEHLGTGLALVEEGSTVSVRQSRSDSEAMLLFSGEEPNFLRAVAVEKLEGPFVFVYASVNRAGCSVDVLIGRVPRHQASDRRAYRFWNGSTWVTELTDSRPILRRITGGLGTVAWNEYLGRYISGFSDMCTGGTRFLIRSAPRPEGPWTDPVIVDLAPLGADSDSYAGQLHPALGTGRKTVISYYQPTRGIEGRVHLAEVTLR